MLLFEGHLVSFMLPSFWKQFTSAQIAQASVLFCIHVSLTLVYQAKLWWSIEKMIPVRAIQMISFIYTHAFHEEKWLVSKQTFWLDILEP